MADCTQEAGSMVGLLSTLRRNESGATSIEYALIAALISIGVVSWGTYTGQTLTGLFDNIAVALSQA
jgi:pilus assembly protein Flp/PilA